MASLDTFSRLDMLELLDREKDDVSFLSVSVIHLRGRVPVYFMSNSGKCLTSRIISLKSSFKLIQIEVHDISRVFCFQNCMKMAIFTKFRILMNIIEIQFKNCNDTEKINEYIEQTVKTQYQKC
jgi:hypothetical protein